MSNIEKALKLLNSSSKTNYEVWKNTSISQTTLANYRNGKTKPTPANAQILIQYFEGSTLDLDNSASKLDDINYINVPFVPVHAHAGYTAGYGDKEYIEELPTIPVIVDRNYKGKYRVFEVEGDSMDNGSRNALYDGDKILCREVKPDLWKSKLHFHDWFFVIVCKNDGITVKQIIDHQIEDGVITCHPLNPMFDDFTINLQDVAELYNVIKIVDRNSRI